MAVAYVVEDGDEGIVLLAEHMRQLDSDVANLLQRLRAKEIRCVVVVVEKRLFLRFHHRGELLQVANHEQLHTAKGLRAVAVTAQHEIDGVEQVGANHRYLVDDEHVEGAYDAPFLLTEIVSVAYGCARYVGREGQLEERMDGHSIGVDSRHTRRRHHNHALRGMFFHSLQERGLTRSGLSRKENAGSRVLHEVPSQS